MIASDEITVKQLILKVKEWLQYFLSKWLIFLICCFIGACIGVTYATLQKPVYTASLSFALEEEKGGGGGLSGALGLASSLGFDLGGSAGGAFAGPNLVVLMKSRRIIEQTLLSPMKVGKDSTTIAEYFIDIKGWRANWADKEGELNRKIRFPVNSDETKFSLQQDSIIGVMHEIILKNHLNVSQKDKKISILSIDVRSGNELFAKNFVESLAKQVSDFYIETKSKKAKGNLELLEKQVDSVRRELNAAITGVAVANDNTYNLNPALNIRRTPSTQRQIDVQANTAILTELVKNLELAKVTLRKETPLIQVIDVPILPLQKEKPGRLKSLIVGGFIAFFITAAILFLRRWWWLIFK